MNLLIMKIASITIIGIATRTTNHDNEAMKAIPELWNSFFSNQIDTKIPNKKNDILYAVYTNYDAQGYYDTIIGMEVAPGTPVPEGMKKHTIPEGNYAQFIAQGHAAVGPTWYNIWTMPHSFERAFTSDFEVYRSRAQDQAVEIYVAVK